LVISRLARTLEHRIPELARIESLQTGRAFRELNAQLGRLPEWLYVIRLTAFELSLTFRVRDYYAALLRTYQSFVAPTQGKLLNYVQRVPLGVVAQITVRHNTSLRLLADVFVSKMTAIQSSSTDRRKEDSTCSCGR